MLQALTGQADIVYSLTRSPKYFVTFSNWIQIRSPEVVISPGSFKTVPAVLSALEWVCAQTTVRFHRFEDLDQIFLPNIHQGVDLEMIWPNCSFLQLYSYTIYLNRCITFRDINKCQIKSYKNHWTPFFTFCPWRSEQIIVIFPLMGFSCIGDRQRSTYCTAWDVRVKTWHRNENQAASLLKLMDRTWI